MNWIWLWGFNQTHCLVDQTKELSPFSETLELERRWGKKGMLRSPTWVELFCIGSLGHSIFLTLARLCRRIFELPQCLQQLTSIPYKRLRISTPVRSFKTGLTIFPLIRIRISLSFLRCTNSKRRCSKRVSSSRDQ